MVTKIPCYYFPILRFSLQDESRTKILRVSRVVMRSVFVSIEEITALWNG